MVIIGITGGSGSGKSTVANIFCTYGAETIDADIVYHDLLNNSVAMMNELKKRFPQTVNSHGQLNRRALAEIVFSDKNALSDLNSIAHKFVIEETERKIARYYEKNVPYLCIDAIALFESGLNSICDVTIGVTAPRATRISRIISRDNIDSMAASARINAQADDAFYKERCDYVISNDGTQEDFEKKAFELFNIITKGPENTDE